MKIMFNIEVDYDVSKIDISAFPHEPEHEVEVREETAFEELSTILYNSIKQVRDNGGFRGNSNATVERWTSNCFIGEDD